MKRGYVKYDEGGSLQAAMGMAQGASTIVDGIFGQPNKYGRKPLGAKVFGDTANMAAMGAQVAGPWGAVVGGAAGLATGLIGGLREKREEQNQRATEQMMTQRSEMNRAQALLASDPTLVGGKKGAQYFAYGGPLTQSYMASNGQLSQLSSNTVEVNGPSHANGGVMLGNNEVEGGETIKNDFVYSKVLGFAREHKKIAKAIGGVESKGVSTPKTENTLARLRDREQYLAQAQELLKSSLYGNV